MKTQKPTSQHPHSQVQGLGFESDRQNPPPAQTARRENPDRPRIDYAKRQENRNLSTPALLALLKTQAPDLYAIAQVVGKWVWVQFSEKQPPQVTAVLAQLGFHWNNKRQCWQHPCGPVTVEASPDDPRAKYGATFAAQVA